ncbi:hypothetical protein [Arthrobacter sp. ISL-69]|uniref:hypothetical protein n=1 Tax=Arthrobacter sp. ISL-69 TaxID=2819113 RepID=UPI002035EDC8|nr:hypothetical protein [Arthrobacter sp. ISL-69]
MPAIQTTPGNQTRLRAGAAVMTLAGLVFVAYAVVFLGLNFTGAFLELGVGLDQVDKGMAEVEAFSPQLHHYISHLHIALSGFIAATGLAIACQSWYGVRRGERWAFATAVVVPTVGLAVALLQRNAKPCDEKRLRFRTVPLMCGMESHIYRRFFGAS